MANSFSFESENKVSASNIIFFWSSVNASIFVEVKSDACRTSDFIGVRNERLFSLLRLYAFDPISSIFVETLGPDRMV